MTESRSLRTETSGSAPLTAYLGCYTTPNRNGHGHGIEVYRVDSSSGSWTHIQRVDGEQNPSFFAVEPQGRFLCTVHGGDISQVSAFAIDQSTGGLTLRNRQS